MAAGYNPMYTSMMGAVDPSQQQQAQLAYYRPAVLPPLAQGPGSQGYSQLANSLLQMKHNREDRDIEKVHQLGQAVSP